MMAADSTSAQRRKTTKPLMEKRRRARINRCLSELKGMVLATKKEDEATGRASRLEKADILEMTVRYVRRMNKGSKSQAHYSGANASSSVSPDVTDPIPTGYPFPELFEDGYKRCIREVDRFVSSHPDRRDNGTLHSLLTHLQQCLVSMATTADGCSSDSRSPSVLSNISSSSSTDPSQDISSFSYTAIQKDRLPSHRRMECMRTQCSSDLGCSALFPFFPLFVSVNPDVVRATPSREAFHHYRNGDPVAQRNQIYIRETDAMWRPW